MHSMEFERGSISLALTRVGTILHATIDVSMNGLSARIIQGLESIPIGIVVARGAWIMIAKAVEEKAGRPLGSALDLGRFYLARRYVVSGRSKGKHP
jgi:hypothetical protein